MSVGSYTVRYYVVQCDECGLSAEIRQRENTYSGAQAVRFLGWSYGKDGRIKCPKCRENNKYDRHKNK